MILATKNDALWDEIGATPDIEDGVGPVLIGHRAVYLDEQGAAWYVCSHSPWADLDAAWLEAYTSGDSPAIVLFPDGVPAGWTPPAQPVGDVIRRA